MPDKYSVEAIIKVSKLIITHLILVISKNYKNMY